MTRLVTALELPRIELRSFIIATRILTATAVMDDGGRDMEARYPYAGDKYELSFISQKSFEQIKVVIRAVIRAHGQTLA